MRQATLTPERLTILSAFRDGRPFDVNERRHAETVDALRADGHTVHEAVGVWEFSVERSAVAVDVPFDAAAFYAARNRQAAFIHGGKLYTWIPPEHRANDEPWSTGESLQWRSRIVSQADVEGEASRGAYADGVTLIETGDPDVWIELIGR